MGVALALSGCAKAPPTGAAGTSPRLAFMMNVDGKIRTGLAAGQSGLPYIYMVALRLNTDENPTTDGPLPVVVPGGNGFVAGNCTHYIKWDPLDSPQFKIWQFADTTMNQRSAIGTPVIIQPVVEGDKIIRFEVDISQLVPAADVATIKSVQVNFFTMTTDNPSAVTRQWDALGDARIVSEVNRPALVRLRSAGIVNSTTTSIVEPQGDVLDPDLDITDWSVEVKLP
ncbi:MAG: hypothetical protein ABUL72_05970 [Armatimonadota bacterium]